MSKLDGKLNGKLNDWNNNYCMSKIKGNDRKCMIKCCNNTDFCSKHGKNHIYNNDYLNRLKVNDTKKYNVDTLKLLDELANLKVKLVVDNYNKTLDDNYGHNLLDMYDSWSDVDPKYHVKISNNMWDIRILVDHISQQLNNSNMENPFPIYPTNPFTRIPFTVDELKSIKDKILELGMNINIALYQLLNLNDSNLNEIYVEAMKDNNRHSIKLLNTMSKKFRFKIINNKNSQDLYLGLWTSRNDPLSSFEKCYMRLCNMEYQIYNHRTRTFIVNPRRIDMEKYMDNMAVENVNINDNKFCVKLKDKKKSK